MNIKDIELFSSLSDDDIKSFEKIINLKKTKKNEILFYEGDEPKYLHILLKGTAKVYKLDKKGNEILIHYFNSQSLIAELANLENIPYPANCKMEEDGIIAKIDFEEFRKIMESNGKVCFKILKSLTKKMKRLDSIIQQNLILDTKAKVAKFIYENEELFLTLKQHKIASILNIKPETLSRTLKIFKESNIIENNKNNFIIKDKEKLIEFFN